MWRCEDAKMRGCEDERMWGYEDVKMRGCEDKKIWRGEDVLQTPIIGRTLRSDALRFPHFSKLIILKAKIKWTDDLVPVDFAIYPFHLYKNIVPVTKK
jgi:hypothetical protein